jgi:hypothetical protein
VDDGLRVDAQHLQVDFGRQPVELFAPGVPDVLRLAEAPRQRDFPEPAPRRGLVFEDLRDVVTAQRNHAAQAFTE